jgi:vacuolar-type H+-ATPase subunit H
MTNDPVQQIKEAEAKAGQKIEDLTKKHHTDLDEYRMKKEKELEETKENLRKKGQESLEKAKQEAMTQFKKITEDEDRNRSSIIGAASSKKDEAVKLITQTFEKELT